MESIYGPPPGARQPHRRSSSRPPPRWQPALQGFLLLIVGIAAFALLIALEAGGGDDDDPLRRLERIQLNLPRYDPIIFDMPAFKPLQSAEIIPNSAIHPAEASATAPPKRLQTAGIISR